MGQFLTHRETNLRYSDFVVNLFFFTPNYFDSNIFFNLTILLRYLALEGLCLMSNSEFSVDAVRKHQETVVSALKVSVRCLE